MNPTLCPALSALTRPRLSVVLMLSVCGAQLRADEAGLVATELSPRSIPSGPTLFTELSPDQTGIFCKNDFADPQMWSARYTELMNGSLGTGVAVADFDHDERPDIFVISKTGPSRLFRNLGNWKFADVTVAANLATRADLDDTERAQWTQGAAWADVNNDGWLDLFVGRFNAPNQLFINQRDGTFREEAADRGLAVTDASGVGSFFDFDRDGWLDVYVHTNLLNSSTSPDGQRDYLFHNRGDGTFEDITNRAGITGKSLAHAVCIWDYDEDGWPDIYVANDFSEPDRLYRNNRDGTFTDVIESVVPHVPYSAMGADVGDINNDGRFDLMVADMAATTHEKDYRGMAYSRTLKKITGDAEAPGVPQFSHNALFLNTGTTRCLEAAYLTGLSATDWTWSVRFEDLDNDGRLDLHITNGMIREYQNVDLLDRMVVANSPTERIRIMRSSPVLAETNLVYQNLGDLRFAEVGRSWGLNQTGVSFGTAFGDFDGDGDLDLVFSNFDDNPTVLRNDCVTGHRLMIALEGTTSNRFGVGATVRVETNQGVQVRQLIVARGYLSTSEPLLHFGLGEATIVKRLTVNWPSGRTQSFTDLPADRRYQITEPTGSQESKPPSPPSPPRPPQFVEIGATVGLALARSERAESEIQPLVSRRFDRLGPALAAGGLNNDGVPELVLGGTGGQPAQILFKSDKYFAAGALQESPLDDGPLLFFDYDGDGLTDLLQTRAGASQSIKSPHFQPVLYRNRDRGLFAEPDALPVLPTSVGAAVAADFDGDGRLDLFLGARVLPDSYPQSPRSALLRNVGDHFEDVTDSLAPGLREPGMVTAALWSDVDGDGAPDLLLALEWGGVRCFHNDGGRGFTDVSAATGFATAGPGWWTSLCSADFNGDGKPDYVAGNTGLNTLYQPPALLFVGNFKGGRSTQIVEAYAEDHQLYPRRTRKELGSQLPAMLRDLKHNDDYAQATLARIVGADKLAAAQRFAATELRSGVFLSQPDGTYRFEPLPRIAQIAPLQGMVAGDFNGDGFADLYAVQNSSAPNPGIGPFDGGLSQLLLGDGTGRLIPQEPARSGLVVPGDAKALVVIDLDDDGWPDFIVTRNGASTLAWRNQGEPGHHSLHVVVPGQVRSRTTVGTRLRLEMKDGSTQTAEVTAGGGYYSQSMPGAFFGWTTSNPPQRLLVRWPDGTTSEQNLQSGPIPPKLAINQP